MKSESERATLARGIEQARLATSNRFRYVDREPIAQVVDGVDFGPNFWCIARSPTAALFWDAGHSYFGGIGRREYGESTLIAWERRSDHQGHRAYSRLGAAGGRLTHDRLIALGDKIAELFGSAAEPRDYELMNWVARAAGRPPRTLLIQGGGEPFRPIRRFSPGKGNPMTEKRESTITARVYEVKAVQGPGPRRMAPGWYYEFEGEEPEGPFRSEIIAGNGARAVIVDRARPGESSLRTTIANRRDIERRALASDHFAGTDRRMRDRRAGESEGEFNARAGIVQPAPGTTNIGGIAWRDLAVPGDHHLDRTEGRNKYAVINMRKLSRGMSGPIAAALTVLRQYGVLNDGAPKTEGEFFVLMLKDEFSDVALLRYADAARAAGMGDYADDILQLTMRAGHGSPWCKRPD